MKSKDFGRFSRNLSELLRVSKAYAAAEAWLCLAEIFDVKPDATVAQIVKGIPKSPHGSFEGPSVQEIMHGYDRVLQLCGQFAKAEFTKDLKSVAEALRPHLSGSVLGLVEATRVNLDAPRSTARKSKAAALREDVVERHLAELDRSKTDERAFALALAAVKADKLVKVPELKLLAKKFSGETADTKLKALTYILRHHAAIMESRAKDAATGGRSAA